MPARHVLALLLALSALPALPGTARAQQGVSDADRSTARALATEGLTALEKKDYVTAADRLARAEAILHAPTHLLALARAQVGLGRWVSAQETYRRAVREGAPPGSPAPFLRAVDDAGKELEALGPRVPGLIIELRGPTAAVVLVDGATVPAAAIGVKRPMDPGQHLVRATADGFTPAEATVLSVEGKSDSVILELKAIAPAAPGPITAAAAAPPGDTGAGRRVGGIVAISLGGALVAMGAVMLGLELSACNPNVDPSCDPTMTPPYGIISGVGFGLGAAGVITGVVLLATLPKAPPAKAAILPILGPGFVGVGGRF